MGAWNGYSPISSLFKFHIRVDFSLLILLKFFFPSQDRAVGGLNEQKLKYAHETAHIRTLAEVVKTIKPTAIIGEIMQTSLYYD